LEARRMVGSPLRNFVAFLVGKASGCIDPSTVMRIPPTICRKKMEKS
jgi:hypothetical protein